MSSRKHRLTKWRLSCVGVAGSFSRHYTISVQRKHISYSHPCKSNRNRLTRPRRILTTSRNRILSTHQHRYESATYLPTIMKLSSFLVGLYLLAPFISAQDDYYGDGGGDYNDYGGDYGDYGQQDNLYQNYADRQENKAAGGGGGPGLGKLLLTGTISWFLGGRIHSKRVYKKLKVKHSKEQKQLYAQYYNDVYKLSQQNEALSNHAEELKDLVRTTEAKAELEALQRDYDEFKQPDIDGDDRISRAEFNMYVKNYLASYPGLSEKDYPKFDDFDHDGDGFVSFQEYSQQMAIVAAQAEKDQLSGTGSKEKTQALKDLSDFYR